MRPEERKQFLARCKPTAAQVEQYCRTCAEVVASVLPREKLPPIVMVYSADPAQPEAEPQGEVAVVEGPFDEETKAPIMRSLGQRLYQLRRVPVAVVLGSEAWVSAQHPDLPKIRPEEDPQRREVVLVQGMGLGRVCVAGPIASYRLRGKLHVHEEWAPADGQYDLPLLAHVFGGFFAAGGPPRAARAWGGGEHEDP